MWKTLFERKTPFYFVICVKLHNDALHSTRMKKKTSATFDFNQLLNFSPAYRICFEVSVYFSVSFFPPFACCFSHFTPAHSSPEPCDRFLRSFFASTLVIHMNIKQRNSYQRLMATMYHRHTQCTRSTIIPPRHKENKDKKDEKNILPTNAIARSWEKWWPHHQRILAVCVPHIYIL